MSLMQIEAEIAKLTPEEIQHLQQSLADELARKSAEPINMAENLGCTRGMMTLLPGWDQDEPLEMWEALRDDTSL